MKNLQAIHTFHLNAQAQQIIYADSVEKLVENWQQAKRNHQPVLLLGGGSNVIFLDDFYGSVIVNQLKGITLQESDSDYLLHVAGGENWHQLVEYCVEKQIGGMENLALIPGCAGTAPIQNIGAYGVEFKDVCDYVDVLDLNNRRVERLAVEECQFGYRESIFKHQYREHYAVIAVGLKLSKNWQPKLAYGPLAKLMGQSVTPKEVFAEVCAIRQSKLPDPNVFGNAGSFFKNPVISAEQFSQLAEKYPAIPHYPQKSGAIKLAAGWLIDQCQLKGYQCGGAAVHELQALVLINKSQATGADVVALAKHIYQSVLSKFAVELEPEVRFIAMHGEIDAKALISG